MTFYKWNILLDNEKRPNFEGKLLGTCVVLVWTAFSNSINTKVPTGEDVIIVSQSRKTSLGPISFRQPVLFLICN